jgi:hypothetical protein
MKTKLTLINEIGKKVAYDILTDSEDIRRCFKEGNYTINEKVEEEVSYLEKSEPEFYNEFYSEENNNDLSSEIYNTAYEVIEQVADLIFVDLSLANDKIKKITENIDYQLVGIYLNIEDWKDVIKDEETDIEELSDINYEFEKTIDMLDELIKYKTKIIEINEEVKDIEDSLIENINKEHEEEYSV